MKKTFALLTLFILLLTSCGKKPWSAYDVADIKARWASEIAAFDALNQEALPDNPILFYGSSSIRLWKNIEEDLAPLPVVKRGYGGASLHDATYYAKRVLQPISYSALVVFIANDIWGRPSDKSPEEIEKLMDYIVRTSQKHRPEAPVFIVEITQTPARAHLVKELEAANAQLEAYAKRHDQVHFIPTKDLYMDADGQMKPELFMPDQLHQNAAGYAVWSGRIKAFLQTVLIGV